MKKNKVILVDGGILTHQSIFDFGAVYKKIQEGKLPKTTFLPPVGYTYMSKLISALKKVGLNEDDLVIVGIDDYLYGSWRSDYLAEYKAQRKGLREKHDHINWKQKYSEINRIIEQLNNSTKIQFLRIDKSEYDDIASVAVRKFKDKECVIISGDQDLEQLAYFDNVKIFSMFSKYNGSKGCYKIVKDPIKVLNSKIKKGDISDNIIPKSTDENPDFEIRELIVNLLKLPKEIEERIEKVLDNLPEKENHFENLPFPKSLAKRFPEIYSGKGLITYEQCIKYLENKKKKQKKKAKEKLKSNI